MTAPSRPSPSPLTPAQLVDEYFIENRNRLIELAAFLDRIDRADPGIAGQDFRMRVFHEAVAILASGAPDRLLQIQLLLSDPTSDPLPALDRKGAKGAWDRPAREARR